MSQDNPEPQSVETSEEDVEIFIADPEDYQKTKKLEAIHKAKQKVSEHRMNRTEITNEYYDMEYQETGAEVYRYQLAQLVSLYGSELLPMIEDGLRKDVLNKNDMKATKMIDIRSVVTQEGKIKKNGEFQFLTPQDSMMVYRQLERIQRKLGLGLELEEDEGPAKI
jgi:hypothetical protein